MYTFPMRQISYQATRTNSAKGDICAEIYLIYYCQDALQSLTGSLQGRITTQGDPCSHYREWVCRVQLFSVLVTFFPSL